VEKRIASRQLVLKNENSNNLFITLRNIVFKYELPSPVELLDNLPNKNGWKRTTQTTINQYWKDKLIKDVESYIIKIFRNRQLHCGKTSVYLILV
jgi:hypothetical protein